MNYPLVVRQLGLLLLVLSACLAVVAGYGYVELYLGHEGESAAAHASLLSTGIGAASGGLMWWIARRRLIRDGDADANVQRRDAFLLTGTSWLIGGVIAALPLWFWVLFGGAEGTVATSAFQVPAVNGIGVSYTVEPGHEFASFASCYFEAVSGLTTTGATVLGERGTISDLPNTLLLWRSLMHWLGGLGIVVLFVAVLPSVGAGAKRLFQSESSAQDGGVRPRIGETARVLWLIYLGLTASALVVFRVMGMPWFDALNHALSVMATGGYSTRDASVGAYNSVWIDMSVVVFMLLAGTNFAVFYKLVRGQWRAALKDREMQIYFLLKVAVSVVIALNIWGQTINLTTGESIEGTFGQSLRYASFQTASLQTGTGFATADWDNWPRLSLTLLFGLMFIGGCAGSTAGGAKVIRVIIATRVFSDAIERSYRPSVVRTVKVGGQPVDSETRQSVVTFLLIFFVVLFLGSFLLLLFEPAPSEGGRLDPVSAMLAPLVTFCNVGPGMYEIGAVKHFGWFTAPSKLLMSFLMVLGRLELFALLVLLTPRFWRA